MKAPDVTKQTNKKLKKSNLIKQARKAKNVEPKMLCLI
jgi:hypothetical protein